MLNYLHFAIVLSPVHFEWEAVLHFVAKENLSQILLPVRLARRRTQNHIQLTAI